MRLSEADDDAPSIAAIGSRILASLAYEQRQAALIERQRASGRSAVKSRQQKRESVLRGLERGREVRSRWSRQAIIAAIHQWTAEHHDVEPTTKDWKYAGKTWPSYGTVCQEFGTFTAGLVEARRRGA